MIREKLGTHEYTIRSDSPHDDLNCGGGYDFIGCKPSGNFDEMSVFFHCNKCDVMFMDLYGYNGYETYAEIDMPNQYKDMKNCKICGKDVIVWGDLKKQLCIPCDERSRI